MPGVGVWFIILGVLLLGVALFLFLTHSKKGSGDIKEMVNRVQEKYDPDMGVIAARYQKMKSEKRTAFAAQSGVESRTVTDMVNQQRERVEAEHAHNNAASRLDEVRSREMKEHDIYIQIAQDAQQMGVSVESMLKLREAELMKQLEIKSDAELARQKIKYALIAKHLLEHQNIASLQEQIDALIIEAAEIESGSLRGKPVPEVARARLIADREQTIATYQEDKRGREKRLIQAYQSGENAGGSDTDSDLR